MWGRLRLQQDVARSVANFAIAAALLALPVSKDVATLATSTQPVVETALVQPLASSAELIEPPTEVFDFHAGLDAVPDVVPIEQPPAAVSHDILPPSIKAASLPPVSRLPSEPFANDVVPLDKGGLVQKWRTVMRGLRAEQHVLDRCRAGTVGCPEAAKRFLAVIDAAKKFEGDLRIAHVNRAINLNIRATTDIELYGVAELWATPLQTFARNAGDCEDYAIAKYVALREIGVPAEQLRLVVVRDERVKDYHAVAAVRSGDRWMILDNRTLEIRADSEVAEFDPLYVLDQAGVRQFDALAAKHRKSRALMVLSANEH